MLRVVGLSVGLLFLWAPVFVILLAAISPGRRGDIIGDALSLSALRDAVIDAVFLEGLATSVFLAVCTGLLATALGATSAYVVSRVIRHGRFAYVVGVSAPAFIPPFVSGFVLLPYYEWIGIGETIWGVLIAHVCFASPIAFVIIWLGYLRIGQNLEDAARNLGAGKVEIFQWVLLPLIGRYVAAAAVVAALLSWNEFGLAWFLGGFTKTIPVVIFGKLGATFGPTVYAFSAIVVVVSMILIFGVIRTLQQDKAS